MNSMKNTVQLIGFLGSDPESKEFPNGNRMATLSIATTERVRSGKNEWKEETQWHRVVAWGKLAERVVQTLRKGSKTALQGRLVHRKWESKDGQTRFITEVVLTDFQTMSPGGVRREVGQVA
jgi:single-strand DNA-binding protein